MFDDLDVPKDLKGRGDKIGGFTPFTSGIYPFKIVLAYADKSEGGAASMNFHLQEIDGTRVHREALWVTSGDKKGNKPYYIDSRSGEEKMLPGYEATNDLCLLAAGKPLTKIKFEEKTIELYDYEAKGEIPQQKKVATELIGKTISVGLLQRLVNKNVKDDSGKYVPTSETKLETIIDKCFRMKDGLTTTEVIAKATEAKAYSKWEDKFKDQVVDETSKKVAATGAGSNGADKSAGAGAEDNPFA